MYHLGKRLKALYADSTEERDQPIRHVTLDYPQMNDRGDIDAEAVLKEISGYSWPERRQIKGFNALTDDGSTACGSWHSCGAYPAKIGRAAVGETVGQSG